MASITIRKKLGTHNKRSTLFIGSIQIAMTGAGYAIAISADGEMKLPSKRRWWSDDGLRMASAADARPQAGRAWTAQAGCSPCAVRRSTRSARAAAGSEWVTSTRAEP